MFMAKFRFVLPSLMALVVPLASSAADWTQWGRDASRNAVSPEKNPPSFADGKLGELGREIAWKAELEHLVVPPVVANGLVWVCTRGRQPEDEKIPAKDWDGGVLKCLRESDGKLLWKHRTPRLSGNRVGWGEDFVQASLGSVPMLGGDRLWYVNNRSEVVCFDIAPLRNGTGEPREVWKLDMRKDLKVYPHLPLMQFGFAASVAGWKDKLYIVTHNGVDETYRNIPAPDAPSLVCLDKATGRVVWKDNSPGRKILQHQVSSPLVAEVGGRTQVIVGQGDGWLRSFDPATGKIFWQCDLNSKDAVFEGNGTRNYIVATPVLFDGRVYVPTGQQVEAGWGPGNLYCIDPTKNGDVSRELEIEPKKGKPNPNSAVVWYTPHKVPDDAPRIEVGKKKIDLLREQRDHYFGRTIASVTVHDGLLYAAELDGYLYCFDAKTGKLYWVDDLLTGFYGQPLWVDGKVYIGTEDGDVFVFAHGKEKKRLAKVNVDESINTGLVFANSKLYITTRQSIYAIRSPK